MYVICWLPLVSIATAQEETLMKGRRKVKTNKWHLVELFKIEAQHHLEARSSKANRFLDVACSIDEPGGMLAGSYPDVHSHASLKS
jgi:hypothetical protein